MDANRVTQQLRRDTEMLEARQARLQQMAASTQTSRKWPNVHYRYSRDHTGMLGTTQAEAYKRESRYASILTIDLLFNPRC